MKPQLWQSISMAILLVSPSVGQVLCKTRAQLKIVEGTQAASCFSKADADSDGQICEDEMSAMESCIESFINGYSSQVQVASNSDGTSETALVLHSGADCSGDTLEVLSNAREDLCEACFDVCGRQFPGATSPTNKLNVRSIRVKSGMVRITYTACYGNNALGADKGEDLAAHFSGPMDTCFNVKNDLTPMHFELFEDGSDLKGAKQYMAFRDADNDGFVSRSEAEDMSTSFDAIDTSGDGMISTAEMTGFIASLKKKSHHVSKTGYGRAAFEDMARARLMGDDESRSTPTIAEVDAEALRLYGEEYTRAKMVTSHTSHAEAKTAEDSSIVSTQSVASGQADGSVHTCADGRLSKLSLCYKPCNWEHPHDVLDRCWGDCPSGTTDIGLFCSRSIIDWDDKPNYYRGVGTPPKICKLGGSFGPGQFTGVSKTQFTFGIVADPQLPWCSVGDNKGDEECAIRENQEVIKAVNNIAGTLEWKANDTVRGLSGVFLNGDLTSYAHEKQFDMYRKLYETNKDAVADNNLKLPIWPNLGNHDYANNLNDCHFYFQEPYWLGYGSNGCAQRMLAYVRSAVTGCGDHTIVPAFGGQVDHYDLESAAYTVSFGKLRAVMLHNYPSYDASGSLEQYKPPMDFLKKEIEHANSTKAYLMLFYHDNGDHFKNEFDDAASMEFIKLIQGSRAIATFHGHIHSSGGDVWGGLTGYSPTRKILNQFGKIIPAIRTFAPDKHKFAVVDYNEAECYFRFGCVDASGSVPTWYQNEEKRYMNTYELPDCTKDAAKECAVGDCSAGCPACMSTESCISNRCVGWSVWVEEGSVSADKNKPLSSMKCQNGFCDKIAVLYDPAFDIEEDGAWSSWADDEEERFAHCPLGTAAIQVACKGSCDKVRLNCAKFPYLLDVHAKMTGWISEEHGGEASCPQGSVITGVECKQTGCLIGFGCGHHCDDKRLLCTPTHHSVVTGNLLAQAIGAASAAPAMLHIPLLSSILVMVSAYLGL